MKLKILRLSIDRCKKNDKYLLIVLVLLLGFFIFQKKVIAKNDECNNFDIVFTEIMYNPEGSDSKREWIEIFNKGECEINLEKWFLIESSKEEVKHKIKNKRGDDNIKPGKYAVIVQDDNSFLDKYIDFEGIVFDSSFSLSNKKEEIALKYIINNKKKDNKEEDKEGDDFIIFKTKYKSDMGGDGNGYTLELDDKKWRESYILGGTPGEKKSKKPKPKKYYNNIRINELLPNPEGRDSKNEFIEIYNYGDDDIDLNNWILEDSSKNRFIFLKKDNWVIKGGEFLKIKRSEFKFSLNNDKDEVLLYNPNFLYNPKEKPVSGVKYKDSQEGLSYVFNEKKNKWEWSSFLTPGEENKFDVEKEYTNKIRINEILPNPIGNEKTDEFIELYNFEKENIDLKGWILKDLSKTNQYIFPENAKIKKRGYLKIYKKDFKFALNNSGNEEVFLINPNKKVIDSVLYKKAKEGVSYCFEESSKKWRWSRFLTPGKKNKFDKKPKIKIDINKDAYRGVYIDFEVSVLNMNNLKVKWDFGDGKKSYKAKTRHKYEKSGEYKVLTSVFNGSEDFDFKEIINVEKFPKKDIEILSFMPNPIGKDSDNEWIEIKNNHKKKINLKNWSIATGKDKKSLINHPIKEDFKVKKGEVKKITRKKSKFSLNNKAGYIEVRYPDGREAFSVGYSKEEGIGENLLYMKNNKNWEWIIPGEEVLINNLGNNKIINKLFMEKDEGVTISNNRVLGISKMNVDRSNIFFNFFVIKKELIDLIWETKQIVREDSDFYYFNPAVKNKKHYALKFIDDLF